MENLKDLKIGDKVLVCTLNTEKQEKVLRIGKRTVSVSRSNSDICNYHIFRKSDGFDLGPTTRNVYFLRII